MKNVFISLMAVFAVCSPSFADTLEERVASLESRVNELEGSTWPRCAGKKDGFIFERKTIEVVKSGGAWVYKGGLGFTGNYEFKVIKQETAPNGAVILVTRLCSNSSSEGEVYSFLKSDVVLY